MGFASIPCIALLVLFKFQLITCDLHMSGWHFVHVPALEHSTKSEKTNLQLVFARNSLECATLCLTEYENGGLCVGFVHWESVYPADRPCQLISVYSYVSKYANMGQAYYLQEAVASVGKCPAEKGYQLINGSRGDLYCLRLTQKPFADYDSGKAECEADGAFLFHLDGNIEERRVVAHYIRNQKSGHGDRFFIGLTDRVQEGEWVWDYNGKKVKNIGWFPWYGRHPHNDLGTEDCIVLLYPVNVLAATQCNRNLPTMCEIQMVSDN